MRFCVGLLTVLLFLPACSGTFDSLDAGPNLADAGDRFSEAMRWRDFRGAGVYLQEDVRSVFLERFPEDDDFHIVESRIAGIEVDGKTETTVLNYRLEYYRLPSMRVKKWRWDQQWRLHSSEGMKSNVWLIENPPPPLL